MRRPFAILLASAGLAVCSPLQAQSESAFLAPEDATRGVLSFNGSLAQSLPSVVRIFAIGRNPETGQEGIISSGSGVVIDAGKGEILTNSHVVDNATKLQVQVSDGRTLDARIIGRDPDTDIALITVAERDLQPIARGDSQSLKVGDLAFAVGYPLGLEQTLTMGIISGLGRSGIGEGLEDYIQTDAPINSGNSGGALLDSRGRLIGINTAILSGRGGGNIGIGFAVPVQMAMAVADQLRQHGEVRRGRIGVSIAALSPERARTLGLSTNRGALIGEVSTGSPAAVGGLAADDVIIEVNGRKIETPGNLTATVSMTRPGESLQIVFMRSGQVRRTSVVAAAPEPIAVAVSGAGGGMSALGATFRDLRPGDPFPQGIAGALVTNVAPGSAAAERGLQAGDLVVGLNNEPVRSAASLNQMLTATKGRVQFVIARGNSLLPLSMN
jgi:Do/DeqQ family serine protease